MTTERTHTAKKAAKRKAPIRGRAQKKDLHALLQQADDDDYLSPLTETLKGRVIFNPRDISRARRLKRRSDRINFIQHLPFDRVKEGIKASAVELVINAYDIPRTEGYRLFRIPQTTLRRRLEKGKLLPEESDRVYRYAELMTQATDMMQQDSDQATAWFKTEMDIFGGETPMQHAMTEIGAREVEDLIGRIRHGVFS